MTTTIYLGKVAWNNKYSHVVNWETPEKQHGFFANFRLIGSTSSRLLNREAGVIELDITYNELLDSSYNYIKVDETTDDGKKYLWYAFITAVDRNARNTAIINYEIDYWNTYFFGDDGVPAVMDIKDSFIKREHQKRWFDVGNSKLRPIFSRTHEQLEVGERIKDTQIKLDYYLYKNGVKTSTVITPYLLIHNGKLKDDRVGFESNINGINLNETRMFLFLNINTGKTVYFRKSINTGSGYEQRNYLINHEFNGTLYSDDNSIIQDFEINKDNVLRIVKLNYLPFRFIVVEETGGELYISTDDDISTTGNYQMSLMPMEYRKKYSTAPESPLEYTLLISSYYHMPYDYTARYLLGSVNVPTITHTPSINDNAHIRFEPKLLTREFTYLTFSSTKSENFNIYYENLFGSDVNIYINSSLDLWTYEEVVFRNYNKNDMFDHLRTKLNNEIALTNIAYLNYMKNNREQIAVNQNLNSVKLATGIATAVGGGVLLATGSLGLGSGLIAGGGAQIINSVGGLSNELAKQNDYTSKVDEVKSTSNTLMLDIADGKDKYHLTTYTVADVYLKRAHLLFMKQGYLVNEYRVPILDSRYYFNYIQCSYVELNPQRLGQDAIKNIIENIYLNGVTIWHYRDAGTFKFLDYTKENWEMEILNG